MAMFMHRVFGAMMLDATVFEDVESSAGATWQATAVVVLSSLAAGIGIGGLYDRRPSTFAIASVLALAIWIAWATLTLQIGTRVLPERATHADLGELMRTVGFAASPGLFQIFAVFPRMTLPVIVVTSVWMFAAMVVAVQRALDYRSVTRAIGVCLLGAALVFSLALVMAAALSRTVS